MSVFAIFNEIGIVNQLATAVLAASLPEGVHPSHFSIINHLVRLGDGKTPIRIAGAMQVTKNTMTHSLRVLESRGFIEVRANPDDGRGKLVFLTARGQEFREQAIMAVGRQIDQLITPDLRERLVRIKPDLVAIRSHLDNNRL
ncbi:MAG: MarR family transcriptional regulator [Pseudomonadota bacterium]